MPSCRAGWRKLGEVICKIEIEVFVFNFLHILFSSCLVLKMNKRLLCVSFMLVLILQIIAFLIEALPYI